MEYEVMIPVSDSDIQIEIKQRTPWFRRPYRDVTITDELTGAVHKVKMYGEFEIEYVK